MEQVFALADELGPEKVIYLNEPSTDLKAIVVVDNVACGPAIGGARMAPDVSTSECARLARAMTLKNAAAGLPHGGAKSVIFADPAMPPESKERLMRAFALSIRDVVDYIVGPDMGTDEQCMAWVHDEIGRAVGLPAEIGGIPLDEIGATGYGLAISVDVAAKFSGLALDGARIAVQGFGSVGVHAARFLAEQGAVLVAAADSRGAVCDPQGIDVARLAEIRREGGSVRDYDPARALPRDAVIDVECDIWIAAARPDVITAENVDRLHTRMVVQGANIPVTEEAEVLLHERGVLSVPDIIANAGGVICASVEYHGGTQALAFQTIEEKIRANTERVLERAEQTGAPPREGALELAEERVRAAMRYRRRS